MKLLLIILLFTTNNIFAEYKNTNGKAIEKPFKDLVKWITSDVNPNLYAIEVSNEWKNINLHEDDNYIIWIGHSTFLIKKAGITILTDPVFSDRASPFKNIGPERLIPPAIPLNELPKIDFVTVSHNHYDHLDINSLKKISELSPNAVFLVPAGDLKLLKKRKIDNVYQFNWWEAYKSEGLTFTFTPVQHWSKRGLFDRNKSLWGGWYMNFNEFGMYHAGDTGYSKDFIDTRLKLGSPKYAFIPIGAYDPEWFMAESHVNPEDAIQIMIDLQAEKAFGMHWGTFALTDEDTLEPPSRLKEALKSINSPDFISLIPGKVIEIE
jgi:L-ascorbate metabolism protein UlaG (beta-lactamase superfamily)